jgi:hypothetical protein
MSHASMRGPPRARERERERERDGNTLASRVQQGSADHVARLRAGIEKLSVYKIFLVMVLRLIICLHNVVASLFLRKS